MGKELTDLSKGILLLGERFESQAQLSPAASALTLDGATLTYGELNARVNRLAACLRQHGIGAESLVGIRFERSFELIVGIFAILKAGGAYLPLDLASPQDRISFMLEDSGAKILLTDSRLTPRFDDFRGKTIFLDQTDLTAYSPAHVETTLSPASLAYVIYTSGSTGTPKGVLVTHENVMRLFSATDDWFHFGPQDVWTLFHSSAFDFSVWEIFGPLLYGGRLVIVPYNVSRSAEAFHDLIVREKVTVLNQTPSAFRQLVQADREKPKSELALRTIVFGGEALEFQSLAPWFERYGDQKPQCVNMYGITETTVHVTYHPITAKEVAAGSGSNIGIPIPDLQVYVVNPAGQRVAVGEVGEMLVGGKGVARGYLNRPELTKERFVPNTYEPKLSPTLYRSGDSARVMADGSFEYLGRIDQQVKIRGFRIELSEIEFVLARYPGIRECAVVALAEPGADPRLVAYLVPDPQTAPTVEALRAHLSAKLPDYMVPAAYVFLAAFPLTINGKLDRAQLPAPGTDRPRLAEEFVAPKDGLEENLAKIWCSVLRLDSVGVNDNFFDLGGDSLLAMAMLSQVEKLVGRPIGIRPMLEGGTIVHLAAGVRTADPGSLPSLLLRTQAGNGMTPFFFAHGDYYAGGFYCQKLAQMLSPDQTFYSLAPHGLFGGDAPDTIEEMATSYVELIRSVQPHGPYRLGGFCNGAVAMYEVAQQLILAGEKVVLLVLLDPPDLYFFILRRRIMQTGKLLGMSEGQGRTAYQRIAEGVEIWKDHGPGVFVKEFFNRSVTWVDRRVKSVFEIPVEDTKPNLNFHYYEALARYEPRPNAGTYSAWIILREGESDRHPKQISYWSSFITRPRFEVVVGMHLEFKSSMHEIAAIVSKALHQLQLDDLLKSGARGPVAKTPGANGRDETTSK